MSKGTLADRNIVLDSYTSTLALQLLVSILATASPGWLVTTGLPIIASAILYQGFFVTVRTGTVYQEMKIRNVYFVW